MNDITDENGRVLQDYLNLIEKLKNKIIFFSEFSRLKKAIPKEWYVQLSEEKSVKTTIKLKFVFARKNVCLPRPTNCSHR